MGLKTLYSFKISPEVPVVLKVHKLGVYYPAVTFICSFNINHRAWRLNLHSTCAVINIYVHEVKLALKYGTSIQHVS